MELTAVQIAFVVALFTAGTALAALFRLVNTSAEAVRKELLAELERRDVLQTKARHDANGRIAGDMLKLDGAVETLKRETVRKEDLAAIESRITQVLAKLEGKLDTVTDRLANFAAVEKQVNMMEQRLDTALRRLEGWAVREGLAPGGKAPGP